jgi:hypothetical protein
MPLFRLDILAGRSDQEIAVLLDSTHRVVLELIGAAEATAAGIVASQPHGCWGSIPHSVGQRKSVCRMANIRSRGRSITSSQSVPHGLIGPRFISPSEAQGRFTMGTEQNVARRRAPARPS